MIQISMKLRLIQLWETLRSSYWLVLTLMAVLAFNPPRQHARTHEAVLLRLRDMTSVLA